MGSPFDRLPAGAAPLAREWPQCARMRRLSSLRMAEQLVEFRHLGVLPDLSPTCVSEFAAFEGLSATEARQLADVGVAVAGVVGLKEDVLSGRVSLHGAGVLGRVVRSPVLSRMLPNALPGSPPVEPAVALASWRRAALEVPAEDLKRIVDRGFEQIHAGVLPIVTMTFHVPESTRKSFAKAREIASRKAKEVLTDGRTLTAIVEHYLDSFDRDRVKPGRRRMPHTYGREGRSVAAAVKREVRRRLEGRCQFPGCTNRIWIDLAHRVPHSKGGGREAKDLVDLCRKHHRRFDRGEFTIEGSSDAPEFYDAKRRRIGPNGRIVEDEPGKPAPP